MAGKSFLIHPGFKIRSYFAAKGINAILNQRLTFPRLPQIYDYLMNGDECTLGGVFSLIVAIPSTLLYNAITGEAPFAVALLTNTVAIDQKEQIHMALGVFAIIKSIGTFYTDIFTQQEKEDGIGDESMWEQTVQAGLWWNAIRLKGHTGTFVIPLDFSLESGLPSDDTIAYIFNTINTGAGSMTSTLVYKNKDKGHVGFRRTMTIISSGVEPVCTAVGCAMAICDLADKAGSESVRTPISSIFVHTNSPIRRKKRSSVSPPSSAPSAESSPAPSCLPISSLEIFVRSLRW